MTPARDQRGGRVYALLGVIVGIIVVVAGIVIVIPFCASRRGEILRFARDDG